MVARHGIDGQPQSGQLVVQNVLCVHISAVGQVARDNDDVRLLRKTLEMRHGLVQAAPGINHPKG